MTEGGSYDRATEQQRSNKLGAKDQCDGSVLTLSELCLISPALGIVESLKRRHRTGLPAYRGWFTLSLPAWRTDVLKTAHSYLTERGCHFVKSTERLYIDDNLLCLFRMCSLCTWYSAFKRMWGHENEINRMFSFKMTSSLIHFGFFVYLFHSLDCLWLFQ